MAQREGRSRHACLRFWASAGQTFLFWPDNLLFRSVSIWFVISFLGRTNGLKLPGGIYCYLLGDFSVLCLILERCRS